jgi:hypothetical protein
MDKLNVGKMWTEFSTLDWGGWVGSCLCHTITLKTKQPNLKLKTQPKQLLGSLPLASALGAAVISLR